MKLTQIFQKPVDRPIEGVIKADDDSSLVIEVEEYVLTHEISKRLEAFLDSYNNYQNANGAWISGFFGSGKSHLLKIMAMLLENRVIDGVPVLERFLPKCEDAMLKAALQKAVTIPSSSILFNIDQKADVISKTQIDALLAVFVKVFDEMCGYYGKQGYIANFERDLDRRGVYRDFRETFLEITGLDWESGREQALLEAGNIARAYAQVTMTPEEDAHNLLDRYRADYRVSIEDFANQVNDYIQNQAPNFRLNFFVDEVGQYIANNVKLMTNLQTIAESLNTRCRGRAWIIVTAQEDMKDVIGEMSTNQANDFTKIQARFATRMKLTSQNVAEVIQKRLLLKNATGEALLETLYHQQSNNFGTLFDFTDGSHTYRNFRDQQHFINSYPFIPYQFALFQSAIQALSQHDAFEGKHSSVGERSMLAVFQQVAVQIASQETGQLATFDLMFEGIRNALKSHIQQAVLNAENHLQDRFAIQVLKALFLVKYVKEFKASVHNISVLMLDSFTTDMLALQRKVESALNLLEQQTYIQRTGELYEYLTNEEKDVEQEIKNTEVDADVLSAELIKIVFDQILRERKIRSEDGSQDFVFSRRLDEQLFGREYEIAIHFVTPFHDLFNQEASLISHSLGRDELMVLLPPDNRMVADLMMYKRTEKYVQQNISVTQNESIKRILSDKSFQNRNRGQQLEKQLRTLISQARLFVAGNEIEINSADPLTRLTRGFYELVKVTYSNLKMLHGVAYSENDLEKHLQAPQAGLLPGGIALSEAAQELLSVIQSNHREGVRTTVKTLVERFERKRYGWPLPAILCNLALLSAHGKLEVRQDSNLLENAALARALRNTQSHASLILDPQIEFSVGQVRRLKEFYGEFFDKPAQAGEARDLGKETAAAIQEQLEHLNRLAGNQANYPFLNELNGPINRLREVTAKPYHFYLTDLPAQMEELLGLKEQVIAPLLSFWNGPQKTVYDEARRFYLAELNNFHYLSGDDAERLTDLLADPAVFQGNHVQQLRTLVESLRSRLAQQVQQEKQSAVAALLARQTRLAAMPDFAALTAAQQAQLNERFDQVITQLQAQTLIANVRDLQRSFEDNNYPKILEQMAAWAKPTPLPPPGSEKITPTPPPVVYTPLRTLQVSFDKPWLADEADLEAYLQALREAIEKEIRAGKRVQL